MENRTLLTLVALLLAGVATVMLARAGVGDSDKNAFTNTALIEMRHNPESVSQAPRELSSNNEYEFKSDAAE